jgi:hypothetical protein
MATIAQDRGRPALFACRIFRWLKPNSSMEVDMDALDGPARLMAFLDALAAWLK